MVFVVVGVTVASVVDRSAVRAQPGAARGRAEAQLVAAAATSVVDAADPVHAVLEQARVGFGMRPCVLLSPRQTGATGATGAARAGLDVPTAPDGSVNPDAADVAVPAGSPLDALALYGQPLTPADRALVEVFAAQAVLAVERERLTRQAEQGERLRQADRVRTAVLAALSHDLRTPLATIKASVSSLRDRIDRLDRGRSDRVAGRHRRGRRSAGRAAGEPARPVPAADRGAGPAAPAGVGGRGGAPRADRDPGAAGSATPSPTTCR